MPAATKPRTKRTPVAAAAHEFKGLRDWVEVFKVGTHTDSKGRTATFSAADLDEMAANVAGSGVPHVLGHPKHDDPAYAWTKPGDLKREGDSLLARATDINSEFERAIDSGAYRERSISIYRDPARGWVPRHIGWLGAMEPGVTGLQPLQYAAELPDGAEVYEFAAEAPAWDTGYALREIAGLWRGLRDWLIGKEGLELADRLVPDWTLTTLGDIARRITETPSHDNPEPATGMFNRGPTTMPKTYTEEELEAAKITARAEAAAAAQLQFSAQGAELSELRAMRQREGHERQVQDWTAAGLVTPARATGMVEFMAALEGGEGGEFAFSAPDKTEAKKTPIQWFRDFMAGAKAVKLNTPKLDPKTEGTPLDTSDYQAVARAATEYVQAEAKAGRIVSAAAAVAHVTRVAEAGQA